MKDTKLKERLENAFDAFFDDEILENNSLSFSSMSGLANQNDTNNSINKIKDYLSILLNILRQVFLYFPGVSVLTSAVFFLTSWHTNKNLGFGIVVDDYKDWWIMGLIGMFLTILGIGDIRKPKHFLMPVSVMVFSFLVGIIFSLSGYGGLDLFNLLSVLKLPFVLVIPFIVKMCLEKGDLD